VRDAILPVDIVNHRRQEDVPLRQALPEAGAIRFKPCLLHRAHPAGDPPAVYAWLRDDGRGLGAI